MSVWMNEKHHYDLFLSIRGGKRCLVVRRRIGTLMAEVAQRGVGPGPVILHIDAGRDLFRFRGGCESAQSKELATGESRYVATEVAGGFTGLYLAMFSSGNGRPCSSQADFDWFEYIPRAL
jgi:alpha-N-arabinofuranosidase